MRIKAEINKDEEEHWSPIEKEDQYKSRRIEEEGQPEKLEDENNNEKNEEKAQKLTLKLIKDSIIKK